MTSAAAVKERPILLGDAWVRLILAGKKTQTRRPWKSGHFGCPFNEGDILWVREAFKIESSLGTADYGIGDYEPKNPLGPVRWHEDDEWGRWFECPRYRASEPDFELVSLDGDHFMPWKPSIHMPRWACRLFLEVSDVRLEPVAAISHDDAIAEGVSSPAVFLRCWDKIYGDEFPSQEAACWSITFMKVDP